MAVSTVGVSNRTNTSDGRAQRVFAINSNDNNHVGGRGVVNRLGSQPTGTQVILSQGGDYLITEAEDRITTQG